MCRSQNCATCGSKSRELIKARAHERGWVGVLAASGRTNLRTTMAIEDCVQCFVPAEGGVNVRILSEHRQTR